MEVGDYGEDEIDKCDQGRNRVDNENCRKSGPGRLGEVKVTRDAVCLGKACCSNDQHLIKSSSSIFRRRASGSGEHTAIIANLDTAAATAIAIAKDTKVVAVERGEVDGRDDWSREDGYQHESKSQEQHKRQWRRWSQHGGCRLPSS